VVPPVVVQPPARTLADRADDGCAVLGALKFLRVARYVYGSFLKFANRLAVLTVEPLAFLAVGWG